MVTHNGLIYKLTGGQLYKEDVCSLDLNATNQRFFVLGLGGRWGIKGQFSIRINTNKALTDVKFIPSRNAQRT